MATEHLKHLSTPGSLCIYWVDAATDSLDSLLLAIMAWARVRTYSKSMMSILNDSQICLTRCDGPEINAHSIHQPAKPNVLTTKNSCTISPEFSYSTMNWVKELNKSATYAVLRANLPHMQFWGQISQICSFEGKSAK